MIKLDTQTKNQTNSVFYDYDGLGRRIAKTEFDKKLSISERYSYEGMSLTMAGSETVKGNINPDNVKAEHNELGRYRPADGYLRNDSHGNPSGTRSFANRGLQIISETGTRENINYTTDLRNSVRLETTNQNQSINTLNYDVFGESIGKTPDFFGYTGKPFDPSTKMYNYGYRDYSPKMARFSTIDPIRDGSNWFSFVGQDPVNKIDAWGLEINVPNAKDRQKILGLINGISQVQFGYDKSGSLEPTASTNSKGSKYYSDKIIAGINDEKLISIQIFQSFKQDGKEVKLHDVGEGSTFELKGGNLDVIISGSDFYSPEFIVNGVAIPDTADLVLMHELVGHAIPRALAGNKFYNNTFISIVPPATGNAVDNENIVRAELGILLRPCDSTHTE